MAKVYDTLEPLAEFIQRQHMFFVATAPLDADGLVNLSPKGLDSLRILDDRTVAYADLVGSGIETVSHLRNNGRIVVMFCAFAGPPRIVRLHGHGEVIEPAHSEFPKLKPLFPEHVGVRCIIRIECHRISDSCGYAVPLYEFQKHRSQLDDWCDRKGPDGLIDYQRAMNKVSLDGLAALDGP